jgi:hypothetical protein
MAFLTNSVCTTNKEIDILSGTGAINIGTDSVAKTITVGNVSDSSAVNINTGTNGITATSVGQNGEISISFTTTNGGASYGSVWGRFATAASAGGGSVIESSSSGGIALAPGTAAVTFFSSIATNPVDSSVATAAFVTSLTAGTSVQNTTGYNLLCNICVNVTSSTTSTITLGVGVATGPTANTAVSSFSAGAVTQKQFSAIVPSNYYLVVNTTGTIVVASIGVQSCPL